MATVLIRMGLSSMGVKISSYALNTGVKTP